MRINSREELLDLADRYDIKRYEDGRIDKIEAYRRGALIHTSQAIYNTSPTGLTRIVDVQGFLFPEIWNSIETPELNWYDRNPLQISQYGSNVAASPAVLSTFWTYTVPAKRKAFAEVLNVSLLQYTASTGPAAEKTSIGAIYFLPSGKDPLLFTVPLVWSEIIEPAIAGTVSEELTGQSITLMEGDTISGQYRSIATDGNVFVQIGAKLTEFDA